MWLIQIIKTYLGWAYSISRRLIAIAAADVAVVVVATIVSQVTQILAFLLPLKIILLMGSDHVPSYFPGIFQSMDHATLVVVLGTATIGFYVAHILADKVLTIFADRSAARVLEFSGKLTIFTQQSQIVHHACRSIAESIAAVIFGSLAIALLAMIFPEIAIAILGWVMAVLIGSAIAGSASPVARAWLHKNADGMVNVVSALGFFVVTATIVGLFLAGQEVHILYSVVAILLSRQLLRRVGSIFTNAFSLYPRRLMINALFLRGHSWSSQRMAARKRVWGLVVSAERDDLLARALADVTGGPIVAARMTRWHETGLIDTLILETEAKDAEGGSRGYLIKLFDRSRNLAAEQESSLLESFPEGALPAPVLVGITSVEGHRCHVFEKPTGSPVPRTKVAEAKSDLLVDCWACKVPADLVLRYKRSHQLLAQRLAALEFDRLQLSIETPQEQHVLDAFLQRRAEICTIVSNLPLVLLNHDLKTELLVRDENGRVLTLHWGRWQLEPVGAGWPTDPRRLTELENLVIRAGAGREALAQVVPAHAHLAALVSELEKLMMSQRFKATIQLLPKILLKLESIGVVPDRVPAAAE